MISELFGLAIFLLTLTALLAPFESLRWYAGWYGEVDVLEGSEAAADQSAATEPPPRHYIVYLSGIGAISPQSLPDEEIPFLEGLQARLPNSRVVADVFPYAMSNHGLTGQRLAAMIWRWIEHLRLRNPSNILAQLINIRNLFQVAVSADQRYGPVYDLGVAKQIRAALLRAGYPLGSKIPVTLIGSSGGGQIAVGAARYAHYMLKAPLRVISLGGVLSSDPGIEVLEGLWHLYGEQDWVQAASAWVFVGRWPIMKRSNWNRALAAGRIHLRSLGPYRHHIREHYFDPQAKLADGRSYLDNSLDTISQILSKLDLPVKAK